MVRRKQVTGDELSWMIYEELRSMLGNASGVTLAVVPDSVRGWKVVLSKRTIRPEVSAAIGLIERRLRLKLVLA